MSNTRKLLGILSLALLSHEARANVIGSDLQNFNAAASIADGVTVSGAKTLGQGRFSLGMFANTAVNSLPYFKDPDSPDRDRSKSVNDTVTGVDYQIAYGLTDSWDLSLSVPFIVAQTVKSKDSFHGEFKQLGNTELRLASKFQLITSDAYQLALQGTVNYSRVKGNPYTGDVEFPGFSLEILSSMQFGIIDWNLNIGHRWRRSEASPEIRASLPIDPAGDQWLASTGIAIDLPGTDIDVMAELYSAYAEHVISNLSSRKNSIVETMLGVRKPLPYDLEFHAGIGSEINHSSSSADGRIYLGLRWTVDTRTKAEAVEVKAIPTPVVKLASTGVLDRPADVVLELEDIFFKFDSTDFRDPKGQQVLNQLGEALLAQPIERVIIEGYACALGSDDYNFDLSDHRAEKIERLLIQQFQVAPEKLLTVGWGETRAKFDNSREETRKNNRRVTFRIFYQQEVTPRSQNVAH